MPRMPAIHPVSLRFALFYGAFYLGFGAYLPYMPVWFETRGLSPELVGAAAAAGMAGRVLAAPLGALWSDRAARRRDAVIAFAAAALAVFAAFTPARQPGVIIALAGLAGAAFTGVIPLVDAFAMRESRGRGFAFGPARATGSAAFIAGNIGAGALVSAYGGEAALYWVLAGALLTAGAAVWLPPGRSQPARRQEPDGGKAPGMLFSRGLPLAFAVSALVQGAHGFYYAFSAIAWRAEGVPGAAIGALWATGVAAEIVFFAVSARALRRWSPADLLALGAGASVLRWSLLAFSPPLFALFPLQCLHALTFAATYIGFLRYASDVAPERFAATAQAVNSALSGGLVLAGATLASGWAYARFETAGFALMVLPAAGGLVFALFLRNRGADAP